MSRAFGMPVRRANLIDLESILLGAVRAGQDSPAGVRDGSARYLSRKLNSTNVFKVCLLGATAAAAGGYLIEVAHLDPGETVASADWQLVGTIQANGVAEIEAPFSGKDIGAQALAAATRRILTLGTITPGSGYSAAGTYNNVPLTGGSGSGAQATIVVAGGVVTTVTITRRGRNYTAGNTLSASNANLGGAGSGFSIPVGTIGTPIEARVIGIRLTPGTGSNGAAVPSNIGMVWVSPVA